MPFPGTTAWLSLWEPLGAGETRPPPGLARGLLPVPGWVVLAVAGLLVLGTLAHLVWRRRGR